jgi:hypothetical protein
MLQKATVYHRQHLLLILLISQTAPKVFPLELHHFHPPFHCLMAASLTKWHRNIYQNKSVKVRLKAFQRRFWIIEHVYSNSPTISSSAFNVRVISGSSSTTKILPLVPWLVNAFLIHNAYKVCKLLKTCSKLSSQPYKLYNNVIHP